MDGETRMEKENKSLGTERCENTDTLYIKLLLLIIIIIILLLLLLLLLNLEDWDGQARMEEGRSAFEILTGKPTGKRPLGRPRCWWEDNIRMYLEDIGINAENWIDSAQDRNYWRALVNAALNLRVP